ncbi:MAG: alpha/beta hydrolase, partial [Flavobacteriaceae bacterium]
MIFQYNNTPIYYHVKGKGPALVLLHGFLESSNIWNNFIRPLSEKYTVITIDLPGHGKSDTVAEIHTMELMAEAVNSLLISLKISEVILMGHSMGGYVALAFTELFEEKVGKLLLLNSTTEADSTERKENRNRAIDLITKGKNPFLSMAIPHLFSETSRKTFSEAIEILKKEAFLFPTEGIIANIKGMRNRKERTFVLKNFSKEKWIICGIEDPIVPVTTSKSISKQ